MNAPWSPGSPFPGTLIHAPIQLDWSYVTEPAIDVPDFVEGLFVEQSLIVIYGESNSGKTFVITDLSLHIAAEMLWRDRHIERGAVIYVTMEGTKVFRNRVTAWRQHRNINGPLPFASVTSSINLLETTDVQRLIDAIKLAASQVSLPVKLVVIDTLNRALAGGSETEDMGKLITNSDAIRAATGAAMCFVHHSGKDATKGARGSSMLRGNCDTEIEVTVDDAGRPIAKVTKQRDLAGGDVFDFALHSIAIGTNRRGKPITSCYVFPTVVDRSGDRSSSRKDVNPDAKEAPGQMNVALDILKGLLETGGTSLMPGVPIGQKSLPEDLWRTKFYGHAEMIGEKQDTKSKAFRRAAKRLRELEMIGVADGFVYVIDPVQRMNSGTKLPGFA